MASFQHLKQTLNEASRKATRLAESRRSGTVNVAGRRNIKIASNVGRSGAVERVTAIQDAPAQQGGQHPDEDGHTAR